MVNVILVFVSLLLLVLAVISSLLGCLAVCCSPQTVPSQVRRDAAKDVEEVRLVNSSEPLGIDDHHDKPKTKKFGWKKSLRVRPANPMPTVLNISSTNQQSAVPEPLQTAAELPVATRQLLPPLQTRNDIVTGKSADNEHSEPIDTVVDTSITEPQEIP